MALKIKLIDVNGEKRVPPETMDLLIRFGQHRKFCEACESASNGKRGQPCSIGLEILLKLKEQSECQFFPDE